MKDYNATYERVVMNDEPGYWYRLSVGSKLITEGWSRGGKFHAEAEVHEAIKAREALRSLAGLEP